MENDFEDPYRKGLIVVGKDIILAAVVGSFNQGGRVRRRLGP